MDILSSYTVQQILNWKCVLVLDKDIYLFICVWMQEKESKIRRSDQMLLKVEYKKLEMSSRK